MPYGVKFIDPNTGKLRTGHLIVVQKMGTDPDGAIIGKLGTDGHSFNIEDGDQFWTAIFPTDPFAEKEES